MSLASSATYTKAIDALQVLHQAPGVSLSVFERKPVPDLIRDGHRFA
jgi:hypothetical protein